MWCNWPALVSRTGQSVPTLTICMSEIRFMQIVSGLPDPFLSSNPTLDYVLRGIRRVSPANQRQYRRPITPENLWLLYTLWSDIPQQESYIASTLWAACCTGFFGLMQAGEFTCPSRQAFTTDMLSLSDVTVDSHHTPTMVSLCLRRSKAYPFGMEVTIHLVKTGHTICPVTALLSYL